MTRSPLHFFLFRVSLGLWAAIALGMGSDAYPLLMVSSIGVSLCMTIGFFRRWAAFFCVALWIVVYGNQWEDPGFFFGMGCFFILTLVPEGEFFSFPRRKNPRRWLLSKSSFSAAWVILILGYLGFLLAQEVAGHRIDIFSGFLPLAFLVLRWRKPEGWALAFLTHWLGVKTQTSFSFSLGVVFMYGLAFEIQWTLPRRKRKAILFYDGVCRLCHRLIRFLLAEDVTGQIRFAPLQGETAKNRLLTDEVSDSVVFWLDGKLFFASEAAIRLSTCLGGFWFGSWIFWLIPRPVRDGIYHWVARRRYRFFGQFDQCRLPDTDEKDRFLP